LNRQVEAIRASQPRDALLGRVPGRGGLHKLHAEPGAQPVPGLVLYLVQAGLVFFNADYVKNRILAIADGQPEPPRWFILDASAINHMDSTAVDTLEDVRVDLADRGVAFGIADLHSLPGQMVERSGLADRIGHAMLFESAETAAEAFDKRTPAARPAVR